MIETPYNHYDSSLAILDIKPRQLPYNLPNATDMKNTQVFIPTASADPIIIELCTDSSHLMEFFTHNWITINPMVEPHARIVALKGDASIYGLSDDYNNNRWFCPDSRQVWMFGSEYYVNIKITIRGLCSEFAPFEEMFLHGSSLSINDRGVVIAGTAASGKTTLTSNLRHKIGSKLRYVNEDWGPFSLRTGLLKSTGQPNLYIKYADVRSISPGLPVSPNTHPSDNFYDDVTKRSHILISPAEILGQDNLQNRVPLTLFVIVVRDISEPATFHYLSPQDVSVIENGNLLGGKSSENYFLNRTLFLFDDTRRLQVRKQYENLLTRFSCAVLNNSTFPTTGADFILSALEKTS